MSDNAVEEKQVKSKECRFVTYVKPPEYGKPDLHVAKEIVYYTDGTSEPKINLIYNYKRPYWVVNKGARNFEQHKEWIDKKYLTEYKSTQANLIDNAAKSLGMPYFRGSLRMLQENPYLFGTDIKSTAIIKKAYQERYKDAPNTFYSTLMLDVETDVLYGTDEIIMLTIYYKGLCITYITEYCVKNFHDVQERVDALMKKYLGEYVNKFNIKSDLVVCADEITVLQKAFEKIHEIKPDFCAIWNLDFEINKFIMACARAMVDPKTIFSDPSIPREYQYFEYIQGPNQKVTASGKITPIPPAARWHTVYCPASFYFIDAMCVFKHVRIGKQERPSYSLDNILKEELKLGKLKFEEADGYERLKWHVFMQENYMLEYSIYNRFDCVSMDLLEEKNKDMSLFLPLYSGTSDYEDFKSQPRRIVDQLHWVALENDKVIGTTSKALKDKYSGLTYDMNGWISNLPASLITTQGMKIIEECPELETTIYTATGDLDVSASYPNGGICYNISKETTSKELIDIEGVPRDLYRIQNMLLTTGHVDAVEWCTNILGFPKLQDVINAYEQKQTQL